MTEDTSTRPSAEPAAASGTTRQRKKRKWDQPAESLMSAGIILPGVTPTMTSTGISLPGTVPLPGSFLSNPVTAIFAHSSQLLNSGLASHNSTAIAQKLSQPKIQDELIAREIVINDAEPTIRYKLTKRQTQEEIQKCTGAVVITRGKYKPPNGLSDNEKPLYLHISAGAQLKDTAERIIAVDRAAVMVEEILKQTQNPQPSSSVHLVNGQVAQPLGVSVYLGFDADPSLNIAARIRGPNDQYINHIMNETGANVVLRGQGSGDLGSSHAEGIQPLHLYLSSVNPKRLEHAKLLAENLLDTIAVECVASRVSTCKAYSAVPPPQQLLTGVETPGPVLVASTNGSSALPATASGSMIATQSFASSGVPSSIGSIASPPGTALQPVGLLNYGNPQKSISYVPSVTGGTCYDGYGGIFPQATPLQQVALALRQAPSSTASIVSSTTALVGPVAKPKPRTSEETEKHPPHKRKFQELPVNVKVPATLNEVFSLTFSEADRLNSRQGSEFLKPGTVDKDVGTSYIPAPKMLVEKGSSLMSPPPPRNMPPPPPKFPSAEITPRVDCGTTVLKSSVSPLPSKEMAHPPSKEMLPPPPKFSLFKLPPKTESENVETTSNSQPLPILKLVEYGEEEDDDDDLASEMP